MVDITVTQTKNSCGNTPSPAKAFAIRNFKSIDVNQRTPSETIPIPQTPSSDTNVEDPGDVSTIVIKTQGNITNVNVSWVIKDECSTVVTGQCVATVSEQIKFLLNEMESFHINQRYTLNFCDWCTQCVKPINLNISKTDQTPITWVASWEFVIGDIDITVEESET